MKRKQIIEDRELEPWEVVTLKIKQKRNDLGGYIPEIPKNGKMGMFTFNTPEMQAYLAKRI